MRLCLLGLIVCLITSGCANNRMLGGGGCCQQGCQVTCSSCGCGSCSCRTACRPPGSSILGNSRGLFSKRNKKNCCEPDCCCPDNCCGDCCGSCCTGCDNGQCSSGCCNGNGFQSCGYPESYNFAPSPPGGQVAYPYYTVRGPRDFLRNNPPSIGPY